MRSKRARSPLRGYRRGFFRRFVYPPDIPSLIRQYFARKDVVVGEEVDWDTPPSRLREALISWLARQPRQIRVAAARDWERVSELSDELGQDAIFRAFNGERREIIQQLKFLKGGLDRALWLFLSRRREFRESGRDRICQVSAPGP